MVQILIGGLLAGMLAYFIMPFVISVAQEKKLYDLPDERKTHASPVPSLGGIGIFIGLIISLLLTNDFTQSVPEFQYYIAAFFILFTIGVLDDVFVLSALKKITGQFLVAGILTVKGHLLITSFHGFLGVNELSAVASYAATYFVILLLINSFNLIDGVDGLAGSLGLLSCLLFGVLLFLNNDATHALLAFTMAGALLAFLAFNFHPAKIFMGDSGSMLIGLVNAVLVLRFVQTDIHITGVPLSSAFIVGIGILLLPAMDVLRVFCIRLYNRKSPFVPDRNHLHHLLLNKGFTHRMVTYIMIALSISFITIAFLLQTVNITLAVACLMATFFAAVLILKYATYRRTSLRVVTDKDIAEVSKSVKIVSIFTDKGIVAEED